jgi:3-hydroxybutyryl-CoA dehydrogenase
VHRPSVRSSLAIELTNIDRDAKRRNLILLDRTLRPGTLLLSSSVTVTVSEQSTWIKHPGRLAGIAALPGFLGGGFVECSLSGLSGEGARQGVAAFVQSLGKEAAFVGDSVGMVLPRVVCCLANEAHFALMERVAASEEIDIAMKLGTNYPFGPFEWARKIGYGQVWAVMHALHQYFGEERYRPAPALRRAAEMEMRGETRAVE